MMKSFRFVLFPMNRKTNLIKIKNNDIPLFDRKWVPSVTEQSDGPMDTVASNQFVGRSKHSESSKASCRQ